MNQLIEYTGGSMFLPLCIVFTAIIGLIVSLVVFSIKIKNNKDINRSFKFENILLLISCVILSMFIGGMIGYYFCVFTFLS